MIPNEHTYCEIDPRAVDQWGIPVLRFHWRWTEHEIKQAKHMHQTFVNIIEAMGGTSTGLRNPERESGGIFVGGAVIHPAGTGIQWGEPPQSVLYQYFHAPVVKKLHFL